MKGSSEVFVLNHWKDGVTINCESESYRQSRSVRTDLLVNLKSLQTPRFVSLEFEERLV